jgi:hypothetical protein
VLGWLHLEVVLLMGWLLVVHLVAGGLVWDGLFVVGMFVLVSVFG